MLYTLLEYGILCIRTETENKSEEQKRESRPHNSAVTPLRTAQIREYITGLTGEQRYAKSVRMRGRLSQTVHGIPSVNTARPFTMERTG